MRKLDGVVPMVTEPPCASLLDFNHPLDIRGVTCRQYINLLAIVKCVILVFHRFGRKFIIKINTHYFMKNVMIG